MDIDDISGLSDVGEPETQLSTVAMVTPMEESTATGRPSESMPEKVLSASEEAPESKSAAFSRILKGLAALQVRLFGL